MNNEINEIMQLLSCGGNPQMFIQNMARNNPQISAILQQQSSSGMSIEQFVRQYAKQTGVNIDPLINMAFKRKA